MTCDEIRDRLDPYLAAALDPKERAAVGAHLAECADCRADLEASRFVADRTASLRRDIAPPADLWAGIAPRLAAPRRRLSLPIGWLAAAAVLLIAGSSAVTVAVLRRSAVGVDPVFASTEARYQQAALELDGLYQRVRDSLAPDTRVVLERNLAVIERALGEARAALRADPANRTLEAIVVSAWRRKIDFLERAASIERES